MWITVASRASRSETPTLLFEKAKLKTLGWDYTAYHHLDWYEDGHNHNRVVSIEALIAGHGEGAVITEEDQQSYDRSSVGRSSDGPSDPVSGRNPVPVWLRAMMSTRMAIKAEAQSFSEELEAMGNCKSWDQYVALHLGPMIYGKDFDVRRLATDQPVTPYHWANESFPMTVVNLNWTLSCQP